MDIIEIESEVTTVTPENIGEESEMTIPDGTTILPTGSDVMMWYKVSVETLKRV